MAAVPLCSQEKTICSWKARLYSRARENLLIFARKASSAGPVRSGRAGRAGRAGQLGLALVPQTVVTCIRRRNIIYLETTNLCQNMFSNLGQKMNYYFGTPLCRKQLW